MVVVTLAVTVLVTLPVGVVLGWCCLGRVRGWRVKRERRAPASIELSVRRPIEKELEMELAKESIYDEPCLPVNAISVLPNQAYGQISIRSQRN